MQEVDIHCPYCSYKFIDEELDDFITYCGYPSEEIKEVECYDCKRKFHIMEIVTRKYEIGYNIKD